jgi:pimeloyl-ACP methyl ester carboxylesterase
MALTRPRAFGALVLLSASPGLEEPRARRERRRRDDELSRQMMSRDVRQFLRGWYAQDVFKGLPPDTAAQLVRRRARVNVAEASKVLRHLSPGRTPSNWRRLEALEMPLSIVSGACDTGYVETGKRMARLCPRAVHAIVPRSSHAVLIEQPRRVAGLIRRFAEEVFHEETQVGKRRRLHGCPVP